VPKCSSRKVRPLDERFDAASVLREVLEVLRRHGIPVETASLNVSLLDAAFGELIPQLRTYKAGNFHRPMVIDDVPVLFHAQRRYPFDEIVRVLDREIRPPVEACAEALRREYPDVDIQFARARATRSPEWPHSLYLHSYRLGIDCRFSGDAHADYNQLDLSIWLQQDEATAYPRLRTSVGWLVDEEGGGDWGLDVVCDAMYGAGDYAPHQVILLQKALPRCFKSVRDEIVRKLSEDLATPQ
jgi:hypothetical protein